MSDEYKLDSILTGEKVSMSIADKIAAKKKADREKTGMKVSDKPSPVVERFIDHMKSKPDISEVKSNFSEPELIASQAMSYYYSLGKDNQSEAKHFIVMLEIGKILTKDSTFIDKELANVILVKIISESSAKYVYPDESVHKTSNAFAPNNIKLENEELHLGDAYEQKVQDAIDKYADELLADSVRMFAEAMNFDPRFCDVIVRGDTQFFREVEDMGFPTLALMVKGITKDRTDPI